MVCCIAQIEREMLRIEKETCDCVAILRLSGRIQSNRIACIREALNGQSAGRIVLDLSDVTMVDIEGVRFLLGCETEGVDVTQCPPWVREWMTRERAEDDLSQV